MNRKQQQQQKQEIDDEIIIKHTRRNPVNLKQAFRDAATEIRFTLPDKVQKRYYRHIRKNYFIFELVSESASFINKKASGRPKKDQG